MNSVRDGDYDDCEGMVSQSIWQMLCTGMWP